MKSKSPLASIAHLAVAVLLNASNAAAKAVFAHYFVLLVKVIGTVDSSTNHAATDINQAIALGFDAFALNVGDPTQAYASSTISQLFDAAAGTSFGLFFSFDLNAYGDIDAHLELYNHFSSHANYYQLEGKNLISSYGGVALGPDGWASVKSTTNGYVMPDLDADPNYYGNTTEFFDEWSHALDGVFSWETAWPGASDVPVNTSDVVDQGVMGAADAVDKAYMIGLSSLQYKHCCGGDYYRIGEVNLPERMTQILSLQPEFTEVQTWNDAGESHYIGNIWPEGVSADELAYGNSDSYTHAGWQHLVSSFNDAFKRSVTADQMLPYSGETVTGAMWYRGVLKSCPGDLPQNSSGAIDAVNYAFVLPQGTEGYSIRVSTNGTVVSTDAATAGLNYNSIGGMQEGPQLVEVVDCTGSVVATAASAVDVVLGPVDGFCNFNYYVVGV